MSQLITPDLVLLDADLGTDREGVIRTMTQLVAEQGRATDAESLFDDAWAREQLTDTGVPGGIAIPHCRSEAVTEATLVMARLNPAVDFGATDAPADLSPHPHVLAYDPCLFGARRRTRSLSWAPAGQSGSLRTALWLRRSCCRAMSRRASRGAKSLQAHHRSVSGHRKPLIPWV